MIVALSSTVRSCRRHCRYAECFSQVGAVSNEGLYRSKLVEQYNISEDVVSKKLGVRFVDEKLAVNAQKMQKKQGISSIPGTSRRIGQSSERC